MDKMFAPLRMYHTLRVVSFLVLYTQTLLQDFQTKTAPANGKSHILQDGSYRIVEEEQEAEATIKESVAV